MKTNLILIAAAVLALSSCNTTIVNVHTTPEPYIAPYSPFAYDGGEDGASLNHAPYYHLTPEPTAYPYVAAR